MSTIPLVGSRPLPFAAALLAALSLGNLPISAGAQPRLFTPAAVARSALSAPQAAYLGHLEALPVAMETRLVEADLGTLDAATLTFNLAPGAAVTLTRSRVERRFGGGASYLFEGADDGTFAVVVEREGQLTGNVRVDGRLYTVRPLTGGLHAIVQMDESRFPADHPPGWEAIEAAAAQRWAETPYVPRPEPPRDGERGGFIQRVLVPYTPTAAAQVADILALIQLAFDETNLGYDRSDVYVYVELAYAFPTEQDDGYSVANMLWRLEDPDDGWYDEVVLRRGPYGADLVAMIVGTSNACGLASTVLATGVADSYAVVAQDCATGYYSFGHELGHLQGARHNPEVDPNMQPFPFGHGKYVRGREGWRTVMSYDCPGGCTRILNWSNPDVDHQGVPTGDAALRDNARVLDTTALDIAAIAGLFTAPMARVEVELLSGSILPASGGVVRFEASVTGRSTAFSGWVWITAALPGGAPYGPIFGPQLLRLSPGQIVTRTLQINVPGAAPAGFYEIAIYAGTYPDAVVAFDSFTFRKLSSEPVGSEAPGLTALTVTDVSGEAPEAPVAASAGTSEGEAAAALRASPNPFSGTAALHYTTAEAGAVRLAVYDLLGREVAVLTNGEQPAGAHTTTLDGRGLAPGIYVVRLTLGGAVHAQRVTLLR